MIFVPGLGPGSPATPASSLTGLPTQWGNGFEVLGAAAQPHGWASLGSTCHLRPHWVCTGHRLGCHSHLGLSLALSFLCYASLLGGASVSPSVNAGAEHVLRNPLVRMMTFFFFLIYLLYLFFKFLAVLGLRCCAQAFCSCDERGLLCCSERASHCGGFSCCGAPALGPRASVVVACGLSSCGLRTLERRLSSCDARA